jgi:hypothetical protein
MYCRAFFLVLFDPAANVAIVDFELLFQPLPVLMLTELTISVTPIVSLKKQIADQHAAQVRDARNARLGACDGRQESKAAHDEHHPFHFDRQQEIEIDNAVWIGHSIGQEKPIDSARGADNDGPAVRCDQPGTNARADSGDEIIGQKAMRPPVPFQLVSEHKECQHVEKYVKRATMQKHVCHELPEQVLVSDAMGHKAKIEIDQMTSEQVRDDLQQIDRDIGYDKGFDRSGYRSSEKIRFHQLYARRIAL